MKILTLGDHFEKEKGEVLISYGSLDFFNEYVTWNTKRLGTLRKERGIYAGKYPVFVQRFELTAKGHSVI